MTMPSLTKLAKDILKLHDLLPKKYLSQNFLVDRGVYQKIVKAAELQPTDQVVEVGAGLGFLTLELIKEAGWVWAIEIDKTLAKLLEQTQAVSSNLTIINNDILKVDLNKLPFFNSRANYKVVANIPYHLTAKILKFFLTQTHQPTKLVVLVQKEVADRIIAQAGKHSLLSLSVQYYGQPKIISKVPARCFYPVPRVDSAIIMIDINKTSIDPQLEQKFWQYVKVGFSAKRKKLLNNLSAGLSIDKKTLTKIFLQEKIDLGDRAQHLSLEQWQGLIKKI